MPTIEPVVQRQRATQAEAKDSITDALLGALSGHDRDTADHSQRVGDGASRLAAHLGIEEEDRATLKRAALLHDLGKIAVPEDILNKPGKLSPKEWSIMDRHIAAGANLLFGTKLLSREGRIVAEHHEWFYSQRAREEETEDTAVILADILSVADAYDAIVHTRPYRKGTTPAKALAELRRCAGTQFSPTVVEALGDLL